MSKLQVYAQRCPVMGKAMAVQLSKYGAAGPVRAFSGHSKPAKARIHTSSSQEARALDGHPFEQRDTRGKL